MSGSTSDGPLAGGDTPSHRGVSLSGDARVGIMGDYGRIGTFNAVTVYEREPAYQVEAFPLTISAPDPAWLLEQPSRLLDARSQVVDFAGRDQELEDLTSWRDTPRAGLSVRLLHGPGGQGKTRLATRFAQLSGRADWTVLQARYGVAEAAPADSAREVQAAPRRGPLMIVDYADRWPHGDLLRLLSDPRLHQGSSARVLLLGRSVHWWPAMRGELAEFRVTADDRLLPPLAGTPQAREVVFQAARDRFAEFLGVDQPVRILPPASLTDPTYSLVLALHMAALVAVDAHHREQRLPTDPEGLAAYLLDREYMNWRRLYGSRTGGEEFQTPPSVMARAVFTAILTGPARHAVGARVLKHLELESPSRILTDHRVCYPPTDRGMVLEPLYPDRLAEDFLALLLPGHSVTGYDPDPWAADASATLLARSSEGQAPAFTPRTITFLAASATRWPHAAVQLNAVLGADPALAVDAGSTALSALADVPTVEIAVLEAIEAKFLDDRDVDLDPGVAAVTSRLTPHRLARSTDPAERARLHFVLAYRLMNAGHHRRALDSNQEAVTIYRGLADVDPVAYLPDLAGSLNALGLVLSRLGRREAALGPSREAVTIGKQLAEADVGADLPGLALALSNLGLLLSRLGRWEEALGPSEEAARMYRRLIEVNPDAHLFNFADSLNNLGLALVDLGRREEALATNREAVTIRRRLAETNPSQHLPYLAVSLNNLGVGLQRLGRWEEAVAPGQEAVTINRRLAKANPTEYLPELAMALTNFGLLLARLARQEQALATNDEAVQVCRQLVGINPQAHLPGLALALINLGVVLAELGRWEEALAVNWEAATIRRQLVKASPDAHLPNLASSLYNIGGLLWELDRVEEAVAPSQEAVSIRRQLAQAIPAAYLPDLADSLNNHGVILSSAGNKGAALAPSQEAVTIRRQLAEANPTQYLPDLAMSLDNLGLRLSQLNRHDQALLPSQEAVTIRRQLAEANPTTYLPDLATSEFNVARLLLELGRFQDALARVQEAAHLYQGLAQEDPTRYLPDLADSLNNLGLALAELGRREEALTAIREAVTVRRRLAQADPGRHLPDLADSLNNLGLALAELAAPGIPRRHARSGADSPTAGPGQPKAVDAMCTDARLGHVGGWLSSNAVRRHARDGPRPSRRSHDYRAYGNGFDYFSRRRIDIGRIESRSAGRNQPLSTNYPPQRPQEWQPAQSDPNPRLGR